MASASNLSVRFRARNTTSFAATFAKILTMTTITRRRTGFFDLPLELRQMAYEHFLHEKGRIDISEVMDGDDNHNLCTAHPPLAREMRKWESDRCTRAIFQIRSTVWRVPANFNLDRVQDITIAIFRYDCGYDVASQLETMRANMQQLVDWVSSRKAVLPCMNVMFQDMGGLRRDTSGSIRFHLGPRQAEQSWVRSFHDDGSSRSTVLRTIDGTRHTRSIFEYLLEPLHELSNCGCLNITLLEAVCDRGIWPEPYIRVPMRYRQLDHEYMQTFADTLEAWVEGRIPKIRSGNI